MGFGLRQKGNYALACVEDILFRLHLIGTHNAPKILPVSKKENWLVTLDELSDIINDTLEICYGEADLVMQHRFDILGSGLRHWGDPISWNLDIKSGRKWPIHFYKRIKLSGLTCINGSDVKIPWELSRFQHLMPLIKAYFLKRDGKYGKEVVDQISDWITTNPFCYGVNWTCAMEVAIRACNWIWAWWAVREAAAWTDEFNKKFLKSIWQHGWYIEHNLEDKGGLRTNHYLSDIVGLLFIGIMFPQFKDAKRWKEFGVNELIRCMDEMVYPDGVSFENSTAYHRLVLELFVYSALLCRKNNINLPDPFWERLEKMFEFIMYCMRPDGRMPMIGDSDDGRFFILTDYYDWDRWDFRYLLSVGAVLFKRADFKTVAGKCHEEVVWLFGEEGVEKSKTL